MSFRELMAIMRGPDEGGAGAGAAGSSGDGNTGAAGAGSSGGPGAGAAGDPGGAAGHAGTPGAGASGDFRSQLPPEYRDDPAFANFRSLDDLAKSHKEAQSLIGRKGVLLPREGATPEEVDHFYRTLGKPESPDKYHLQLADGAPFKYGEDQENWWRGVAHKHNLTVAQAKGIYEEYLTQDMNLSKQSEEVLNRHAAERDKGNEAQMRQEWGAAYDQNMKLAEKAAKAFSTQDELSQIIGAIGAPAAMKLFHKVGSKLSEDSLDLRPTPGEAGAMTPAQAQAEIKAITGDKEHPLNAAYFDKRHVSHKTAVARMAELYGYAHPDAPAA